MLKKVLHKIKFTFHSLRNRNYRLFFLGQSISLIGTWMQQVAMSWLVYRLTGSAFLLGLVGFSTLIPTFILTPFTGVLADRHSRRMLMILTQMLSMVQAFVLAALVLTNVVEFWHILVLSIFLGLVNSLDVPARQAFVVDMVDRKEDLSNAIALNSSVFNGARLFGPSIAGIVIAIVGEGACFFINGISFLVVIAALLAMNTVHTKRIPIDTHISHGLKIGLHYVLRSVPIRSILMLLSIVSLIGMPYVVLMPIFAKNILHGGPDTLGLLMASSGVGALSAALYLASRKSVLGLDRILGYAPAMMGVGLIFFSISRNLVFSMFLLVIVGFGMVAQAAASNTIIQTIVDDDKRGRVMSFFAMSFLGTMPFGSLLAGCLASWIGAPYTVFFGGICCVAGSFVFARHLPKIRKAVRPIYVQKGIMTDIAPGVDQ